MKIFPAVTGATNVLDYLQTIARLRREDVTEISNLNTKYVQGRLRTDRTAPSANNDIEASDQLGDIVRSATYEYVVVNDAGTLKWARFAIDVTW